jgi:hypothetical protein
MVTLVNNCVLLPEKNIFLKFCPLKLLATPLESITRLMTLASEFYTKMGIFDYSSNFWLENIA